MIGIEGRGAFRASPGSRAAYPCFYRLETRWMDNGAFRHLNNVTYYSFFDTAVARCLIEGGYLDISRTRVIGLVAGTGCRFFKPIAFPDTVHCGLRVAHIGRSSVRIKIGLFRNDEDVASAEGQFVHVFVDRETSRPVPLPESLQTLFGSLRPPTAVPPEQPSALRSQPASKGDYPRIDSHTTRWMDNDAYRHMNNVVYYSFLDTAITRLLSAGGFLDLTGSAPIGIAAESQCSFFGPISFPDTVFSGLRVAHIGNTSVRYDIALFRNNDDLASAQGNFVHVFVDRETGKPSAIPDRLRAFLNGHLASQPTRRTT